MKNAKVPKGGARAYDIGGFGVGCGVPRVRIIGRAIDYLDNPSSDYYIAQVTSRRVRSFTYGETIRVAGRDLFDTRRFVPGPRCVSQGKEWRKLAIDLPIYHWIDGKGWTISD